MTDGVSETKKLVQIIKSNSGKITQSGMVEIETDGYLFTECIN